MPQTMRRERKRHSARVTVPDPITPGTPEEPARGHIDIRSRALLVVLNVKEWSGTVTAEDLRDQMVADNGIRDREMLRATKSIVSKDALKKLNSKANTLKSTFNSYTLPWGKVWSTRVCSNTVYPELRKKIMDLIAEYDALVISELEAIGASGKPRYYEAIDEAEQLLGPTAFRRSEYPTLEQVKKRFRAEFRTEQIPDTADIRVDLSKEIVDQIRAEQQYFVEDSVKGAMSLLHDELQAMVERLVSALDEEPGADPAQRLEALTAELQQALTDPAGVGPERLMSLQKELQALGAAKKVTAIRKDLFDSVAKFAEKVPLLNVTGDARLEELAKKLETLVKTNSAADIRNSVPLKADVKKQAEEILEAVAELY